MREGCSEAFLFVRARGQVNHALGEQGGAEDDSGDGDYDARQSILRETHTHTPSVEPFKTRSMSFARVNIASRHRSFDETKTHRAALLEVHEPLLALEKLHASSSHTAVRSSVCARDGRLAFYVVHARVSRRRPRSNPPRLDARDRSNPKLARAPIARTLARASSRALARARDRRHRRVARTFCASTILSLMVDDRSIKQ